MTLHERDNELFRRESHRLSVENLERSDFGVLTDQQANSHKGMQKTAHGLVFEPWKEEFGGKNEVCIRLVWDKNELEDGTVEVKYIEIEFEPSGIILVKGGIRGSLTLLPSSWKDRPDIQRQALEKAIQHPIVLTIPSTLPSHT